MAHDITLAKEAEIELRGLNETLEQRIEERTGQLRANEARLRAILETTNQYQALLDLDGILFFANAVSFSGIGRDSVHVVGMPFWDTPWFSATPAMRDVIISAFETAASGQPWRSEVKLIFPAGDATSSGWLLRPMMGTPICLFLPTTCNSKLTRFFTSARRFSCYGLLN